MLYQLQFKVFTPKNTNGNSIWKPTRRCYLVISDSSSPVGLVVFFFFSLNQVNYAFTIQINYVTNPIYLGPSRIKKAIGKLFHYLTFFILNFFFLNWVPVIPSYFISWGLPGGSVVKNLPVNARDKGLIPGDPLEKEVTTHSSILAWKIPWTEVLGRLESIGSQS